MVALPATVHREKSLWSPAVIYGLGFSRTVCFHGISVPMGPSCREMCLEEIITLARGFCLFI